MMMWWTPYSTLITIQGLFKSTLFIIFKAAPVALVVKNLPALTGDIRDFCSIPGSGRSAGGGHDNLLSILAWKIPQTEEPGEL